MRPFIAWYMQICFFSALVALAVQDLVINNLNPLQIPDSLKQIVPFLMALSLYIFLYRVLMWLYEWKLWKVVLKKYDISGTWYHEYLSPADPSYVRYGVTIIDQGIWHVRFNSRNYDQDLDPKTLTLWNSTAVALENEAQLTVAYVAHRCDQPDRADPYIEKTGILMIDIVRDRTGRPCRMTGIFEDTSPSKRRGAIKWLRTTEWSNELELRQL